MASKFVRSVKDIYHLENFNTNLIDENDILSTVDGDVYIYTKNGFLHLDSIEPLQDEMQEVQEKLSDNEKRIYDNEEKVKVIETSVEDNQLKVKEVTEKLDNAHLEEIKQKLDSINIEEIKQKIDSINIEDIKKEQETLSKKIDETTNETNKKIKQEQETLSKKIDETTKETNKKIQSNTDKINEINITDTGWQNITITGSGLVPHTDPPQYRITTVKGIKTVALRGAVKGYKGDSITVGKIPINGEFTNPHYYVQNTSKKSGSIYYTRITVMRAGDVVIEGTTYPSPKGDEWCPINTVFMD